MIGLVVPANLKFCPYVSYYIDLYKKNNIPYEIISWDKANLSEDVDYRLKFHTKDENTLMRIIGYFKFARFVNKICKKKKYSGLLVFTVAPAIVIYNLLKKKYRDRYYLDIRDDTFLRKLFKKTTAQVIHGACGVTVSSNEFNTWIGRETTLCHNVDVSLIDDVLENSAPLAYNAPDDSTAKIMYAGMMIEEDINIELIDKLNNDDRFLLIYHGSDNEGKNKIVAFCKKNNIKNVLFYGTYKKEEIHSIYQKEANWCNIIRANTVVNKNALPNKLYDAMLAGVPVIVLSHNKAICDYVKKYDLGLIFDDLDDLKTNFFEKEKNFDRDSFSRGRLEFLEQVKNDSEEFKEKVLSWTKSILN